MELIWQASNLAAMKFATCIMVGANSPLHHVTFVTGYAGPALEPAQIHDPDSGQLVAHPISSGRMQAGRAALTDKR